MNTKKGIAFFLTLVMSAGILAGCSNTEPELTEEEIAAASIAEMYAQLEEEELQTGYKRLQSQNLEAYEAPVADFLQALHDGNAEKMAELLDVPNTFGDQFQNWVIVHDLEELQKLDLKDVTITSTKAGSTAVIDLYYVEPGDMTDETKPDLELTTAFSGGAWIVTPSEGILLDYVFTSPTKNVSFQGTDLSSYAEKSSGDDNWTFTLPRMIDLDTNEEYLIKTDIGEFYGTIHEVTENSKVTRMLLADIDGDKQAEYEGYVTELMEEVYRLMANGAGETDMATVLLSSTEVKKCIPESGDSEEIAARNESKRQLAASVLSVDITRDDTLNGYPSEYLYRLDGNDGLQMNVKIRVSTESGEARLKAVVQIRMINGSWKITEITSKREVFSGLSIMDPEW